MVTLVPLALLLGALSLQEAEELPQESDFYELVTLQIPDGLVLEVSAIAILPDQRPIVATCRGEVYIVEDAYDPEGHAEFHLYTDGLQEPLGLLPHDGWIYVGQRGELSRMQDRDGDGRMDVLETVCDAWRISGNYHEYLFGPVLDDEGNFWVTTNKPFGDEPFGRVDWRGFALRITPDGKMLPTCCGLRSPAGVEKSPWGDLFYTDNQGEWCGASKLSRLVPGSFHGHPWGIFSCEHEEWTWDAPPKPRDGVLMPEVPAEIPSFELPAVWFPYEKTGNSPAGFVWDETDGAFGPFAGQLFVGDQHHSSILRVALEEVDGHWQGAVFPFREGFQCGIIRLCFAPDASLFAGMTNRGWGSRGNSPYGLQRLLWTGATPFEIHHVEARPDGFVLHLTGEVDRESAASSASYRLESYTYELHSAYGSDEMDRAEPTVTTAVVAADGRSVRLMVDGLRAGYVHELHADGLRSAGGDPLLHADAYYTLIRIPAE